jgi:hypothetical protein
LPAPLFIGSTTIRGASTHFGKETRPDRVMLQLGQRSSDRDVWLWVPVGTSRNQASPWSSPLTLSHWRECNELPVISSLPPQGWHLVTGTSDFIRNFPPMSAVGPPSTRSRVRCSRDLVAGQEEAEMAGRLAAPRRDLLQGFSGREIMATDFYKLSGTSASKRECIF